MNSLDWIKKHKDLLSINSIEKRLGMPQGTLAKAIKGTRPLTSQWLPGLDELVRELRK